MSASTLLVFDERMIDHDPGMHHPEHPSRLRALGRAVEARREQAPGTGAVAICRSDPAPRAAVEAIHSPAYLDRLDTLRECTDALDADTGISPGSVDAAYLAAGAALKAVQSIFEGPHRRAFALVRPPGHHAEHDHAMGFCLLNNVAIAAEYARQTLGARRVLIVDWDVHHGNGTQHAFYDRRDILVFNTHLFPFYPGTGALDEVGRADGLGYTVNIPLPVGMGDGDYGQAFRTILLPIAEEFEPDLVLVSAGFDAHGRDPLGGMEMTASGFAHLCQLCAQIADRHAAGRLALVLEGGYDLEALVDSTMACVDALHGKVFPDPPPPSERGLMAIDRACNMHGRYWTL